MTDRLLVGGGSAPRWVDASEVVQPNVVVSETAPAFPPSTYLWVQTGLGDTGEDFTFWIEDGT